MATPDKKELPTEELSSEKWKKRMKERKPDIDDNDPESFYSALDEYDAERSRELDKRRTSDGKLRDLFLNNPEMAGVFTDISSGTSPVTAFVTHFGEAILSAKDDPEAMQSFVNANQKYLDGVAKSKQLEEEQQANIEKSAAVFEDFIKSKNMTDEEAEAFGDRVFKMIDDMIMGRYTPELFDRFYLADNYHADVNDAIEAGKAEGRNEKIIAQNKDVVGDGLPKTTGSTPKVTKSPYIKRPDMFNM